MNVFYPNSNPFECADEHCHVHRIKMILEYAQLLSTAHRVLACPEPIEVYVWKNRKLTRKTKWHMHPSDTVRYRFGMIIVTDTKLYSATHVNHPSAVWARSNKSHYEWLFHCFIGLLAWHTSHKTWSKVERLAKTPPTISDLDLFLAPPQAMPDEFKQSDTALAYQDYLNYKFKQWLADDKRPATFDITPTWRK